MIEIKSRRFRDNSVLVATWKLKDGINELTFTDTEHEKRLAGNIYTLDGSDVKKNCAVEEMTSKNGNKYNVYVVPMDMLTLKSERTASNNEVEIEL